METLCDFLYAQVAAVAQRSSKTVLTFLACPREFQMNLPDRLRQCVSGSPALQPQVVQRAAVFSVLTILFTVGVFSAIAEQTPTIVTQKGRAFKPGTLVLKAGDTVEIVNDDGELIHHAYVASEIVQLRFGRPGAGQQDRRGVHHPWQVYRPVRHPSQDAPGCGGQVGSGLEWARRAHSDRRSCRQALPLLHTPATSRACRRPFFRFRTSIS